MQLNLPSKIRKAIYVAVVLGTAVLVPLHAAGVVNDVILAVWTSVSGAASILAAVNVTDDIQG